MVTAEASSSGGGGGQEQIPMARNVRLKPRSSVWKNFTPEEGDPEKGDGRRKARCNNCDAVLIAVSQNGTSHLRRHAENCKQKPDPAAPPSCAPSHIDEHESNRLVVNASSDSPSALHDQPPCDPPPPAPPQPFLLSIPQTVPYDPLPPNDPPPPLSYPPSQPDEELPDREHDLEDEHDWLNQVIVTPSSSDSLPLSLSNDYDPQTTMLLSDDQPPLPLPSFPSAFLPSPASPLPQFRCDTPPTFPQPWTDPPPSVTQNLPYNPPLAPSHPVPVPVPVPDDELPDHQDQCPEDEEPRKHLARMIAFQGYDPLLIEDGCFRSFVGSLNPRFRFPSRLAVEQMCDDIFDEERKDLLTKLNRSDRKFSLALGTAQTIHGEVLYTACHFIDDEWKFHRVVLDAYPVAQLPLLYGPLLGVSEVSFLSGFGDRTAYGILGDIKKRGLLDKLFAMVWSIKQDSGEMQQHMKQFISVDITKCVDIALHAIAGTPMMLDPNFIIDIYNEINALDLNLTRESRQKFFSEFGLDHLQIHSRYWYSSYCSLRFLRQHGCSTIADKDYSHLIEVLCKIWEVIYHAIQRISTFKHPTSHQCLVELFKVREVLQSELERTDGDGSIVRRRYHVFKNQNDDVADVLREAMKTLDSILQDIYLVWSVPLVLDPRYKLTYIKSIFSRAFGSRGARYIAEVTRKIKKIYADYVEYDDARINGANSDGVIDETAAGSSTGPLGQARSGDAMMDDISSNKLEVEELLRSLKNIRIQDSTIGAAVERLGQALRSMDGRTDAGSYLDAEMELNRYLNDPQVEETGFDILNWWKDNASKYPTVARMARDALAMPTCSRLSSEQMARVSSIVRGYSKKR